jgi:hypothetical protein
MLADFADIGWIPAIEKVELEGEGIGMVRHVTAPGMPVIHEKLEGLDHAAMRLDYSVPEVAYIRVKNYRAHAQVVPLAADRCRLDWGCEAEADGVDEATAARDTEAFYRMVMGWVGDYLARP